MSETLPTITVKQKADGRVRIINLSDFNPEIHENQTEQTSYDREAAKAFLKEKGVEFAKNISDKKLQELVESVNDPKAFGVVEVSGRFVIVDASGNQQGEETFSTAEDAELMIKLLSGSE